MTWSLLASLDSSPTTLCLTLVPPVLLLVLLCTPFTKLFLSFGPMFLLSTHHAWKPLSLFPHYLANSYSSFKAHLMCHLQETVPDNFPAIQCLLGIPLVRVCTFFLLLHYTLFFEIVIYVPVGSIKMETKWSSDLPSPKWSQ